jgi:hypothetical protein
LLPTRFVAPHSKQICSNLCPHSLQNLAPSRLSNLHFGHFIIDSAHLRRLKKAKLNFENEGLFHQIMHMLRCVNYELIQYIAVGYGMANLNKAVWTTPFIVAFWKERGTVIQSTTPWLSSD